MPADRREDVLISASALAGLLASDQAPSVLAIRSPDTVCPRPFQAAPRIPGAQDAEMTVDFASPSHPRDGARPLPDVAALQETVRRLGLRKNRAIVVYDHDGNLMAARAWWVLRWAGFTRVVMLDGGFEAWASAGCAVVTEASPPPVPSDVAIQPGGMPELDADSAARLARSGVLLDTRIAPNYRGGDVPPGTPARGHIPGAINVPAPDTLTPDGHFADLATLRSLYAATGADGNRPVGVYCGAGVSAAHTVAALMMLGIDAPMYPGSWSAWSADPSRPVATGPEPG
ncbi:rhodanese-related sulfurtransferase [Ameyamaea chiangmaiensis NBRC 103196]|uniref:Sulfurtransferase n=1 Tax=Ameyamaea chiangmaiensis TaxID=442969 RepID=A0A850P6X3_9PROT|nr:sulfurtransferase [Ameyamaea chiangmaiensis]MBS4076119.1 sulfurtransferase [Ameyamaea chiangmaiensis]NVN39634.1 sulfurtransferase [Ameyamaea chiangmaiensis]GBQ67088.1 rhodanese-related sulfurtransferase [Ameyamaea chiangmaiensis NBRC 103196]